jgi:hypothetical protein
LRLFFNKYEDFLSTKRLFEDIFRELEAFGYKSEAFIKNTSLFEKKNGGFF